MQQEGKEEKQISDWRGSNMIDNETTQRGWKVLLLSKVFLNMDEFIITCRKQQITGSSSNKRFGTRTELSLTRCCNLSASNLCWEEAVLNNSSQLNNPSQKQIPHSQYCTYILRNISFLYIFLQVDVIGSGKIEANCSFLLPTCQSTG